MDDDSLRAGGMLAKLGQRTLYFNFSNNKHNLRDNNTTINLWCGLFLIFYVRFNSYKQFAQAIEKYILKKSSKHLSFLVLLCYGLKKCLTMSCVINWK